MTRPSGPLAVMRRLSGKSASGKAGTTISCAPASISSSNVRSSILLSASYVRAEAGSEYASSAKGASMAIRETLRVNLLLLEGLGI